MGEISQEDALEKIEHQGLFMVALRIQGYSVVKAFTGYGV